MAGALTISYTKQQIAGVLATQNGMTGIAKGLGKLQCR